jgi:hypothetical protein
MALATPVSAAEMTVDQARSFVIGKTFAYTCFDGSRGLGRINGDGSVHGTVQMQGRGNMRAAILPANTLRVKGERVCANVKGVFFEPCFNLTQTSDRSFRGTISGFSFAYCDFTRGGGRQRPTMRRAARERGKPLALRSTLAE